MDSYIGNRPISEVAGYRREFIATAGQTTFVVAYAVGYVDVFLNGAKLGAADFTATSGSSVTLAQACAADDVVAVIAWAKGVMVPQADFVRKVGDTMTGTLFIKAAGGTDNTTLLHVSDDTQELQIGTRSMTGAPYIVSTTGPLELRSSHAILFPSGVLTTTVAANAHLAAAENERLYRSTSAARYKTNIETLQPYGRIDDLRPITYTSLCEADGGKEFIGFVVEELADVDPRLADVEGEQYDYRAILAIAVAEIQNLRKRVAALEAVA